MTYRLLSIAGSDSGGGAGIQADIKTASAFGVFASTAITAITAQNTQRVSAVHLVPTEIIKGQIKDVLSDIGADAIKIGMVGNVDNCNAIADTLQETSVPIVLDPVMVSTSGSTLLEERAIDALKNRLIPLATLITPNFPEADILFGLDDPSPRARVDAAMHFVHETGVNLLLKGGHAKGAHITNILVTTSETHSFETVRLNTKHTHGTGCTLSAAIACLLAKGETLPKAIEIAGQFVHRAIENAPGLGQGHGPLDFLGSKILQ